MEDKKPTRALRWLSSNQTLPGASIGTAEAGSRWEAILLTLNSFAAIMSLLSTFLVALASLELASAKIYNTRFKGTTWDDETWTLATTNLDQGHYQSRMSLANGYLGINVAAGEFGKSIETCGGRS